MALFAPLLQIVALAAGAPDDAAVATPATVEAAATPGDSSIDGRRRPGVDTPLPPTISQNNPGAVSVPPPEAFPTDEFPIPDRWRLAKALCPDKNYTGLQNICHSPFDPYHQNSLKGDRPIQLDKKGWLPIKGDDWFLQLNAISDSIVEPRSFPTPVADQTSTYPGAIDQFGRDRSLVAASTFLFGAALTKGSTTRSVSRLMFAVTDASEVRPGIGKSCANRFAWIT